MRFLGMPWFRRWLGVDPFDSREMRTGAESVVICEWLPEQPNAAVGWLFCWKLEGDPSAFKNLLGNSLFVGFDELESVAEPTWWPLTGSHLQRGAHCRTSGGGELKEREEFPCRKNK